MSSYSPCFEADVGPSTSISFYDRARKSVSLMSFIQSPE